MQYSKLIKQFFGLCFLSKCIKDYIYLGKMKKKSPFINKSEFFGPYTYSCRDCIMAFPIRLHNLKEKKKIISQIIKIIYKRHYPHFLRKINKNQLTVVLVN